MAFAALTATLCLMSCSMSTESLTIFLMFRGVMFESEICWRLTTAFASFASFSCCFFILVLNERTSGTAWLGVVGLSAFRMGVFNTQEPPDVSLSEMSRDKMKLAAEFVSRGATMLAEPCPQDGGVQVRYRGKVYCAVHDDLSLITRATPVTYDMVVAQMRDVLVTRLHETTAALASEKDAEKQEALVTLAAKYFELLQKLPK